jgi:hypothetical protein
MSLHSGPSTSLHVTIAFVALLWLAPLSARAEGATFEVETGRSPGTPQIDLAPFARARTAPGATIPLPVASEAEGKADATMFVLGAPKGARITDGSSQVVTQVEDETVETSGWDLSKLAIELPADVVGHFIISAIAIAAPQKGERASAARSLLNLVLDVQPGPVTKDTGNPVVAKSVTPPNMSNESPDGSAVGRKVRDTEPAAPASEPQTASVTGMPEAVPVRSASRAEPPAIAQPDVTSSTKRGGGALTREGAPGPVSEPSLPTSPAKSTASGTIAEANTTTLIERAQRLLRVGDVSGARLVLDRALARGNPLAAFLLAQTYDARVLRTWNVRGIQADPERARELYAKAVEGGISSAKVMGEATR